MFQFLYRLGAVLLDHVCHCDDTCQTAVFPEEKRCLAFPGKSGGSLLHLFRNISALTDEGQVPSCKHITPKSPAKPVPRHCLEIRHFQTARIPAVRCPIQSLFLCQRKNRLRQRMLALSFQCIGHAKQLFFRHTSLMPVLRCCGIRDQIRNPWLSAGDRSGLIQGNNLHLPGLFQGNRRLEHDSVLSAHAVPHHNRNRSRKTQGTGTADDQNRDSSGQGKSDTLAGCQPHQDRYDGNNNDGGDKDPGHPVSNLGNGGFCGRRITDHLDNLGKGRVLPDSDCLTAQEPGLV